MPDSSTPAATPAPTASSIDALVLRSAGLSTVAIGVVAIVVGLAVSGAGGAIGAAIGTAIVVVFFSVGQLILG